MKLHVPATRTCPECEELGLEVNGDDENIFECQICGSIWQRLIPLKKDGKMTKIPNKLKKLFWS